MAKASKHWWKNFKDGDEQQFEPALKWNKAAFLYELRMRLENRKRFKPYIDLPVQERLRLVMENEAAELRKQGGGAPMNELFRRPATTFLVWQETDVIGKTAEPGFSPFRVVSWNLNTTDKALVRAFLQSIHQERRFAGIPTPTKNPVIKAKGLPWRALELMDDAADGVILTDSERSQVNKLRRMASIL